MVSTSATVKARIQDNEGNPLAVVDLLLELRSWFVKDSVEGSQSPLAESYKGEGGGGFMVSEAGSQICVFGINDGQPGWGTGSLCAWISRICRGVAALLIICAAHHGFSPHGRGSG